MAAKKVVKKTPKKPAGKPAAKKTVKAAPKKAAKPATAKVIKVKKVTVKKTAKPAAGKASKGKTSKKTAPAKSVSKIKITKTKVSDKKKSMIKTKADKKSVNTIDKLEPKAAPKKVVKEEESRFVMQTTRKGAKAEKRESIIDSLSLKPFKPVIPKLDKAEFTIEDKLRALYQLQLIDSQIDLIRKVRGELPMEVLDLEDEVTGLGTRITNYHQEEGSMQQQITNKKQAIKDANALIKKYEQQQSNVKNNREYDSLTKEIEFQKLEIQLAEKRIKEYTAELNAKRQIIEASQQTFEERTGDLSKKKSELDNIIAETQKEEEALRKYSEEAATIIEERLLTSYKRIRENALNGLAVVTIQRDACGGCFNKIPPQRQMDIRQHKKVIVCEHCGRILVDPSLAENQPVEA